MENSTYTRAELKRIAKKVLKRINKGLENGITREDTLLDYINENKCELGKFTNGIGSCDQVMYSTNPVHTSIKLNKKDFHYEDIKYITVEDACIGITMNLIPDTDIVETVEVDIEVYSKIEDIYGVEENDTVYINVA